MKRSYTLRLILTFVTKIVTAGGGGGSKRRRVVLLNTGSGLEYQETVTVTPPVFHLARFVIEIVYQLDMPMKTRSTMQN